MFDIKQKQRIICCIMTTIITIASLFGANLNGNPIESKNIQLSGVEYKILKFNILQHVGEKIEGRNSLIIGKEILPILRENQSVGLSIDLNENSNITKIICQPAVRYLEIKNIKTLDEIVLPAEGGTPIFLKLPAKKTEGLKKLIIPNMSLLDSKSIKYLLTLSSINKTTLSILQNEIFRREGYSFEFAFYDFIDAVFEKLVFEYGWDINLCRSEIKKFVKEPQTDFLYDIRNIESAISILYDDIGIPCDYMSAQFFILVVDIRKILYPTMTPLLPISLPKVYKMYYDILSMLYRSMLYRF